MVERWVISLHLSIRDFYIPALSEVGCDHCDPILEKELKKRTFGHFGENTLSSGMLPNIH